MCLIRTAELMGGVEGIVQAVTVANELGVSGVVKDVLTEVNWSVRLGV